VPGEAWNAGFCTIYPRASGGLERPPKPTDIKGAREYVTRKIQSLSIYNFISDERKIMTDIIRVRGYVTMFICKDLQT
jgi:hypothetical protein